MHMYILRWQENKCAPTHEKVSAKKSSHVSWELPAADTFASTPRSVDCTGILNRLLPSRSSNLAEAVRAVLLKTARQRCGQGGRIVLYSSLLVWYTVNLTKMFLIVRGLHGRTARQCSKLHDRGRSSTSATISRIQYNVVVYPDHWRHRRCSCAGFPNAIERLSPNHWKASWPTPLRYGTASGKSY